MGELFVVADRLVHHPRESDAGDELTTLVAEMAACATPYGVERPWWKGVREQGAALVTLLDAPGTDDDEVVEAATGLRDTLRANV